MRKLKLFIYGLIFVTMVLSTTYAKIDLKKLEKIVKDQTTQDTNKNSKDTQETKDTNGSQDAKDTQAKQAAKEVRDTQGTTETQAAVVNWKCLVKTDQPENKVVISPDNKLMLTIDIRGKVKIYDYQTLKIKQLIESDDPPELYTAASFYPNGQTIALGSKKGIETYSIDGKLINKCNVSTKKLSVGPSGSYLVVNSGGSITILDANTLTTLNSITSCYSNSFVFFKEDFLAYLSLKGKLIFYNLKAGKEVDLAQPSIDENKSIIAISDDQQLIYLSGYSKGQVIRTTDWSTLCRFDDNRAEIAAFKHNSHDIMCLNSGHKLITTYNAENGTKLGQFQDASMQVITGFTLDQNAKRLLVTASNGLFIMGGPSEKELTINSGSQVKKTKLAGTGSNIWKRLFNTNTTVRDVVVSSDNQMILTVETTGNARIYDSKTLVQKKLIDSTEVSFETGVFYPDGKTIALGTENGIVVYSFDGKLIKKCVTPTNDLFISPSGNYLVSKSSDTLCILDANTLKTISAIKPFSHDMTESSFAFLKNDCIVYRSNQGKFIFYNLKDGKPADHTQPSIDERGAMIAVSDDQQLMFVGNYEKGQVLKTDDWSTLCQINDIYADDVVFKHNSHDIMCVNSRLLTISTYNAENGTQLDQLKNTSIGVINNFTTDLSGKRLLIAGSGLFIMGAPSEPEIKLPDLGYRPMLVNRKTIIKSDKDSDLGNFVQPNQKIAVSNNEELHSADYYWCKARIDLGGSELEVSGYLRKDFVSTKPTTTIYDLAPYKKVLQGSYQFKDFETIIKSPASYAQCFGEYTGALVSNNIEICRMEKSTGCYLDIYDYGQRFIVEIPSKEFREDRLKGWSEGDQISLYLKFSHIGTFTNQSGMVFRIPVFQALALYDEYRVIYLKK